MEQWKPSEHKTATQSSAATGLYKSAKIKKAQALPTFRDLCQVSSMHALVTQVCVMPLYLCAQRLRPASHSQSCGMTHCFSREHSRNLR